MNNNLFQTQYDVTKKSKLKIFYETKKFLILTFLSIVLISIVGISFHLDSKEKKKIILSEKYVKAKIYLQNNDIEKSKIILNELIFSNDSTYSTLALFLIKDKKFSEENKEIVKLFDYVLKNNKFNEEIKNLLIFKKSLLEANFASETQLINTLKPLINSETIWKPHALSLLGDFFFNKSEFVKATEFYSQILNIKGLNIAIYDHARSQLILANDD
tara:strand:- start:614 stop:1261 length:648 start_codon:yes stop_codon:yes gene_type:complete